MKKSVLIRTLFAAALAAASTFASATPAYSWNLSRSMMTGFNANLFGEGQVWTAMYDAAGETLNPANFQVMPTFMPSYNNSPQDAWAFPSSHSLIVIVTTAPLRWERAPSCRAACRCCIRGRANRV